MHSYIVPFPLTPTVLVTASRRTSRPRTSHPAPCTVLPLLLPKIAPAAASRDTSRLVGEWTETFGDAAVGSHCGLTLSKLQNLYVERCAPLWKVCAFLAADAGCECSIAR